MACGTPVIAYRRGSVPEVIEENVSGFVVDSIEDAVAAVRRIEELDRVKVRAEFERRFTAKRMAHDYVSIYQQLTAAHSRPAKSATPNGRQYRWRAIPRSRPSELADSDDKAQPVNASRSAVLSSANLAES
jgi:hypothetical protein